MADEQRDKSEPSDELNRGHETKDVPKPHPHPSTEEAKQEIEAEDRFEATDN